MTFDIIFFVNYLIIYLLNFSGEKPFVCQGCQKGFNQSGNMRIHEKTCKKYLRLNGHIVD